MTLFFSMISWNSLIILSENLPKLIKFKSLNLYIKKIKNTNLACFQKINKISTLSLSNEAILNIDHLFKIENLKKLKINKPIKNIQFKNLNENYGVNILQFCSPIIFDNLLLNIEQFSLIKILYFEKLICSLIDLNRIAVYLKNLKKITIKNFENFESQYNAINF